MWKVFLFLIHIVWPVAGFFQIQLAKEVINATYKGHTMKNDKPTVEMDDVTALWTDESAQFVCRVRSEVEPQIDMLFMSCNERTLNFSDCDDTSRKLFSVRVIQMNGSFEYKVYGKIAPPEFGIAQCSAENSQGISSSDAKLFLVNSYEQVEHAVVSPVNDLLALPTVEMDDVTVLWTESAQFVCRVRSELESTILMGLIPCDERTLNILNCYRLYKALMETKVEHTNDTFEYKAYGKIAPPKFGMAFCTANNSEGTSAIYTRLYPVHSYEQLDIEIISAEEIVLKEQKVVFRCRSNAYNFTSRFKFIQNQYMVNGTGRLYQYAWEVNFITEILSGNVTCGAYHKKGGFQNVTLDMGEKFLISPVSRVVARSVQLSYVFFGGCLVAIVGLIWFGCSGSKRHAHAVKEVETDAQDDAEDDNEDAESSQICDLVSTIPPIYSFPKDKLLFGRKIGEGEYGIVRMAQAKDIMVHEPFTTVAVKQTKNGRSASLLQGMVSEIKMMILVGQHLNIVNFLGVVTENIQNNELMIILEYCRYGSVVSFMQSKRSTFVNCIDDLPMTWITSIMNPESSEHDSDDEPQMILRTTDLVCWAMQIAFGMEYLSSKNMFHGDLAARNVLLCEKGVVKIADFGLAREFNRVTYYKKTSNDRVPFKWMALESIFEHKFSIKTDVWSYGVLLWELFTLGMPPYATMAVNDEFFQKLKDGYRLERPMYANEDIYYTMLSCWCVNPERRPTFHTLGQFFNLMLPPALQNHYLALNDQYLQMMTRKVKSQ